MAYPGHRGNTTKRKTTCLDQGVDMIKYSERFCDPNTFESHWLILKKRGNYSVFLILNEAR